MHRIFSLHAEAVAGRDGALPQPASPFLRAWIGAALPWASEAHGAAILRHYASDSAAAWIQRFYASPPVVRELVRTPVAEVPAIVAALRQLFARARSAGVPSLWGCETADALLRARPTVIDLHSASFFGCCQPMVSLGEAEQQALAAYAADGWSPAELLGARLGGHVVHELAHGPARGWDGGPGSWMLHEAAAALVNVRCDPAHVIAERPGEPVLGLARALVLGQTVALDLGEDAVRRLALTATHPHAEIGRDAGNALTAADWQVWARAGATSFMPPHDRMLSWARLYEAARAGLLGCLADLDDAVGPAAALALPDLLGLAEQIAIEDLPSFAGSPGDAHAAAVRLGARCLFQGQRLQPDLQVCPSDPPEGRVVLDLRRSALLTAPRADDPHRVPAVWCFPLALTRRLRERGLDQVVVTGVSRDRRDELASRLLDLCDGRRPLPKSLAFDLREPGLHAVAAPARTVVDVPITPAQLHHADPVITVGSCFAQRIGDRLAAGLFDVTPGPFGTLYDPISVARALRWVASDEALPEALWFSAQHRWHSPWHHTAFSDADRDVACGRAAQALAAARAARSPRGVWLITWGTADVWERDGEVVANNHGLDPARFVHRRLDVDAITAAYGPLLAQLAQAWPQLRVVLSVSPIRHLARGVQANSLSKATLLLAASRLAAAHDNLVVFPAYEILMDELRDYRWYEPDLTHVSESAADLIFQRFLDSFVAPASRSLAREVITLGEALVRAPRDAARRVRHHDALLDRIDALPASPALPRPRALRIAIEHARAAALAACGAGPVEPVEAAPAQPAPAPPPAAPDRLTPLQRALRPGAWISWDALEAWLEEASEAVTRLAADGEPADAWAGLVAVLDKAEELEDAAVVADLARPLLRRVLSTLGAPGMRADAVSALFQLCSAAVAAQKIELDPATLTVARTEDLAAWALMAEPGTPLHAQICAAMAAR